MKAEEMKKKKRNNNPPQFAEWILKRTACDDIRYSALGDFAEIYFLKKMKSGTLRARLWYWKQAVFSIPEFLKSNFFWRCFMIWNYILISLRNLKKHKVFSAINILGLSLGLTCCILILMHTADEFSYDRFHNNSDTIYAVYNNHHFDNRLSDWVPLPVERTIDKTFPEVKNAVRINTAGGTIRYQDKIYNESFTFTDPAFFKVFTFPMISGSGESVLNDPNSIVLTKSIAVKYFGEEDPVGKTLSVDLGASIKEFTIAGVTDDVPDNSSIKFGMVVNNENLRFSNSWVKRSMPRGWYNTRVYLQLNNSESLQNVKNRFPVFIRDNLQDVLKQARERKRWGDKDLPFTFILKNIKDVHLRSGLNHRGDIQNSYIMLGIAVIVLAIACINFMNLSIGRASVRSVEIGMRKVLGAGRKQLIGQFWSESILLTVLSMAIGIILAVLLLPAFNELSGKNLHLKDFFTPVTGILLMLLIVLTGIISGSYPALVMSRFRPVEILRGKLRLRGKNPVAKLMVIIQFTMSIFLIISTIVLSEQLKYINSKDLGFNKEGVIAINTRERNPESSRRIIENYKDKTSDYTSVKSISGCTTSLYRLAMMDEFVINDKKINAHFSTVYYDYIKTNEMELIQGRDFSREFSTDISGVIVNEKFVKEAQLVSPLGKTIRDRRDRISQIIGVVKDFHYGPFNREIGPSVFNIRPDRGLSFMLVRISQTDITGTIKMLEKHWKEIQPEKSFSFSFVEDDIARHYSDERKWNGIVRYSSILAVLISCMGIFGLTLITVNRRIKEIGIRKVLGAGISQITGLVVKDFVYLVLAANVIAVPPAYYFMNKYLQNFFYRIPLGPQIFIFAGIISIFVAVTTISYLALKAASANPVDSIKYE